MRLDKYLKVSRIIKRRTVANEACDSGRVMLNDKVARASAEVKVGDVIEIAFGTKAVKVKVTSVQDAIRKELLGDHTETAFSLGNLGVALATAGQWQEAVDTLQEALDCYARAGHTTGPDIEGYRKNLEICHHALKMVAPGTTPQVSDD